MIREALPSDLLQVVQTLTKFHEASPYKSAVPIDYPTSANNLGSLIGSDDGVMVVADKQGIVGVAAAAIVPMWFNGFVRVATEICWWLEPNYRHGSTAIRLMDALEAAARARHADFMAMVSLSNSPEVVERVYLSRGYKPMEKTFMRKL